MTTTETQFDGVEEPDYKEPTVKGVVYKWRERPAFDQCLCELPDEIHILATGQVIAFYGHVSHGPSVADGEGGQRKLKAELPAIPYEDLDDMLEEHCQGTLKPNDLRARLHDEPDRNVAYTRTNLKTILANAIKTWGSFAVQFQPRLVNG